MASKITFAATAFVAAFSAVSATTLTLNDYVKFSDGSAKYNPPTCGVPYDSLDLTRITAWSAITSDQDPKCGSCAKVCGGAGCEYLLIVDQCTLEADHLDISTAAGPNIVGSDTGNWDVTMELVDVKNCAGIWDGRMFFSWQQPNANFQELKDLGSGASPAVFAPAPTSTEVAAYYSTTPTPSPYASPAASSYAAAESSSSSCTSSIAPYSSSVVAPYTSSQAAVSTSCSTSPSPIETETASQSYGGYTISTIYGTGSSPSTPVTYPTAPSNGTAPKATATPTTFTGGSSGRTPTVTALSIGLLGSIIALFL